MQLINHCIFNLASPIYIVRQSTYVAKTPITPSKCLQENKPPHTLNHKIALKHFQSELAHLQFNCFLYCLKQQNSQICIHPFVVVVVVVSDLAQFDRVVITRFISLFIVFIKLAYHANWSRLITIYTILPPPTTNTHALPKRSINCINFTLCDQSI